MARYYDKVGYDLPGSHVNGVWKPNVVERALYGSISRASSSLQPSDQVNDNVRLYNQISVVADAFALENFSNIKYAYWMGTAWTVTSVDVNRPRLILSLGEVYDGPKPKD